MLISRGRVGGGETEGKDWWEKRKTDGEWRDRGNWERGGEERGGETLKQKVNEEEAERGERHIRTYLREYPTGEIKGDIEGKICRGKGEN